MEKMWIKKQGMYEPQFEHAARGIAMLTGIKGDKSHTFVELTSTALEKFAHRS